MKTFKEVTATDGIGEFMIHLDENQDPIRIYTYADFLSDLNNRGYELDGKSAENEVYSPKNWKQKSINTLFVDYVGDIKYAWSYLRRWVSDEEMD